MKESSFELDWGRHVSVDNDLGGTLCEKADDQRDRFRRGVTVFQGVDETRDRDGVVSGLEIEESLVEARELLSGGMGGKGVGDGAKPVTESSLGVGDGSEGRQGLEEGEEDAFEYATEHIGESDRAEVGNENAVGLFGDGECECGVPLGGSEACEGA